MMTSTIWQLGFARMNCRIINLKKGKSEAMIFGTAQRLSRLQGKQLNLTVNGLPINNTTTYKYLGVHLDPTLSFETHFNKTLTRKRPGESLYCGNFVLPLLVQLQKAFTGL